MARCRRLPKDIIPAVRHVTNQRLERIVSRLPGLHSLCGFSGSGLDLDIISRHCPQLKDANLSDWLLTFRLDAPSLERLCRSCPKLETVSLPSTCDDTCVETVLRGLPELRSLDINLANVTGRCLASLPTSLRRLGLTGDWNIRPAELERAACCPGLKELDISNLQEPKSGQMVRLLAICPQLERLNAQDCDVTDIFLEQLREKTPGVRDLNLAGCAEVTSAALKNLKHLKELHTLNLFDTYTNDAVLEHLQGACHLTKLIVGPDLYHAPDFSVETLARLVVSCPSLRLVIPSEMVDACDLVDTLIGKLDPDRDVTIEMNEENVETMEETLPEDGPLRIKPYEDDD